MKRYINIYMVVIAISFVIAVGTNGGKFVYDTGFVFGALNLLIGGLLVFASIIAFIIGRREGGRTLLAAAGLILLTGGITCSIFPFRLNG